jgi:hypothetical protein
MNRTALLLVLLVVCAGATTAIGQGQNAPSEAARQGGPAQPRPPRDVGGAQSQRISTGVITGRVTAADTAVPLRRVEVTATATSNERVPRVAMTDDEGRYELSGLAAGEWRLTTLKAGYISQQFGQRRPFGAAPPVVVADGQRVTADFALTRASAINGRVFDEFGEPLAAVRINVMRSRMVQQRRRLEPVGEGDLTDDTGAFRIYGLPPGEYFVSGSLRVAPVESVVMTTYSPTYYPGTGNYAEAQRVLLAPGTDVDIAFPLLPFRTARVSGVVVTSSGTPADAFLNLAAEGGELGVRLGVGGVTRPDGSFTLADVPPGAYTLEVTLRTDNSPLSEIAAMPMTVYGDDVSGLTVVTTRPAKLQGTVVADMGVTRSLPASIDVVARSTRPGGDATYAESARNAFELIGPLGPFRLNVEPPEGWMVKAIVVDGVDAIELPVDLKGQLDVPARVVLTDRVTELSGVVGRGEPGRTPTVLVFPEDPAKWAQPSRYLRAVETSPTRAFRIVGLPAGELYLAAAVDDLEEGEGDDPEFLSRIRDRATPVVLTEGERQVLELHAIPR